MFTGADSGCSLAEKPQALKLQGLDWCFAERSCLTCQTLRPMTPRHHGYFWSEWLPINCLTSVSTLPAAPVHACMCTYSHSVNLAGLDSYSLWSFGPPWKACCREAH